MMLLLWLLLTGSLRNDELAVGVLVAAVATLIAGPRLGIFVGLKFSPSALLPLLKYFGYFFVALVRANLDLARRVLSPRLPIRPAVVEVETALESDLGKLLLANSITLTPGTLSVDVKDHHIVVHWIDCAPDADLAAATREIAAGFEKHLQGFVA